MRFHDIRLLARRAHKKALRKRRWPAARPGLSRVVGVTPSPRSFGNRTRGQIGRVHSYKQLITRRAEVVKAGPPPGRGCMREFDHGMQELGGARKFDSLQRRFVY